MGESTLLKLLSSYLVSGLIIVALLVPIYRIFVRRRRGRAPAARRRLAVYGRIAAYAMLLLGLMAGRLFIARPGTNHGGAHFNRGQNAVWLGVEWVNEPRTAAEFQQLGAHLTEHQIQDVFVYVSYLKARPPESPAFNQSYRHAGSFLTSLRQAAPQLRIQAWLGLPLSEIALHERSIQETILAMSVELTTRTGFDGVHLDPEPIVNDDPHVLALLEQLRRRLPPQSTLSIATPPMYPLFPNLPWHPWIPSWVWSSGYYRAIAERVDQIAVMSYDSSFRSALLYQHWVRFQVIQISRAVEETEVELFFGIPTSEEETGTHHVEAETMQSGLAGVLAGLNDAAAYPDMVRGVAIYPYWETDQREWQIYRELWLGR
jgi:hypothetical protein